MQRRNCCKHSTAWKKRRRGTESRSEKRGRAGSFRRVRFWKRCCQRFKLLSCLSWRGIFHGNWENKSNFQIGGLREAGGLLLFSPVRAHLLTTPKGRWYAYGIVRSPRGISLSAESDRQCHSTCGRCCHRLRDWANTVASTDAIFPTACANLPPAALPQRWTGVLPVHFLFGHQREPPALPGGYKSLWRGREQKRKSLQVRVSEKFADQHLQKRGD